MNGPGGDAISALPFPLGNIPGIPGFDRPIAPAETRIVGIPSALAGPVHRTPVGRQFTSIAGPVSAPFDLPTNIRARTLNDVVIWSTDQPDAPLHAIPIDSTQPQILRVECTGP